MRKMIVRSNEIKGNGIIKPIKKGTDIFVYSLEEIVDLFDLHDEHVDYTALRRLYMQECGPVGFIIPGNPESVRDCLPVFGFEVANQNSENGIKAISKKISEKPKTPKINFNSGVIVGAII